MSVYSESGVYGSSQVVRIKAREKKSVVLNSIQPSETEPVYGQEVVGVTVNDTSLMFLDSLTQKLKEVGPDNKLNDMFPGTKIEDISWAKPGLGVALGAKNSLFLIRSGSIKPINPPFSIEKGAAVSLKMIDKKHVYLSIGRDIYSGQASGNFKKIYTASASALQITASREALAVIEFGRNEGANSFLVISKGGKKIASKDIDARNSAWSPDGKRLLISEAGKVGVYDNSLNQLSSVPSNKSSALAWMDRDSFLYGYGNQLMIYNLTNQKSHQLALVPGRGAITGIYPDENRSYIYFSTQATAVDGSERDRLYRVGLKGQERPDYLAGFSIFMPEHLDYCYLDYINFKKPTILISYPSAESARVCRIAAETELKNYNISPARVEFQFFPYYGD
ncbi:MAG TPA: hypothetical protein VFK11_00415 [Candidatus Saccharimonadales bacterium]|nr:hypothetical protein [Candidatus Saccharimonadales bacterium]